MVLALPGAVAGGWLILAPDAHGAAFLYGVAATLLAMVVAAKTGPRAGPRAGRRCGYRDGMGSKPGARGPLSLTVLRRVPSGPSPRAYGDPSAA